MSSGRISSLFILIIDLISSTKSPSSKTPLSDATFLSNRVFNLYLPTFPKSYLLGLKNRLSNKDFALSMLGGSPGLIFL